MYHPLVVLTLIGALLAAPGPVGLAEGAPHCRPGQARQFVFGFAALKAQLGPIMGEPIECEHSNDANGDTLQRTTTGLAFWRKSTNTLTFTDGYRHWELMPGGTVYWEGPPIDLPEVAAAPTSPPGVADESRVEATVNRAIDGNSLDAHLLGNRTAVGYLGVETPAMNQACGQEAQARNRELAGPRVLLEADPNYRFDAIGRSLYYAYTPDGQSIDEALVREGLGRAVRTDAHHGASLVAVEEEARAAGRGCLWSGA